MKGTEKVRWDVSRFEQPYSRVEWWEGDSRVR